MRNAFDGLMNRLDTAEGRISELEFISGNLWGCRTVSKNIRLGENNSDLSLLPVQPPHPGQPAPGAGSCPYTCLADWRPLPAPSLGVWGRPCLWSCPEACCASAAVVLCQPRPPSHTHLMDENQKSLPAPDVGVLGEPLTETACPGQA